MSIYHFEQNQLVKEGGEIQALLDERSGAIEKLFSEAKWYEYDDVEGVYALYIPEQELTTDNAFYGYAYAMCIEDAKSTFPWIVLIRDDPSEYLAAMKMVEPLFTIASYHRTSPED